MAVHGLQQQKGPGGCQALQAGEPASAQALHAPALRALVQLLPMPLEGLEAACVAACTGCIRSMCLLCRQAQHASGLGQRWLSICSARTCALRLLEALGGALALIRA